MFHLKPGTCKAFEDLFSECFGDSFLLLSREEMLSGRLFGEGTPHPHVLRCLGDYIAIATGDESIAGSPQERLYASHHAGLTLEEMQIPLIAYRTP